MATIASPAVSRGKLAHEAAQLSVGQGLKLVIQAGYFVLLARCLGPGSYGTFAAVVALTSLLAPFTGLGSTQLFVKNVRSARHGAALCWGNGLVAVLGTGFVFSGIALAANAVFHLSIPAGLMFAVCIADLFFTPVIALGAAGFAAIGRMKENAAQTAYVSLLRLIAIGVLALHHRAVSLNQWALAYLLATLAGTGYCIYRAQQLWGRPVFQLGALRDDAVEGFYFSVGTSAATLYNDVDKIMLAKFSSFTATGIYAAAYRIIDVSMAPVRSLATAAYPRFFEKGMGGLRSTYPYALRLMSRTSAYGILVFAGLWLSAPILPHVLGPGYANAAQALRLLSLLPLLRCLHTPLADSLSGAGRQRTRSLLQVVVAVVNIVLNFAVLPRYGWLGACYTSLASDTLLVVVLWAATLYGTRGEQEAAAHA